MTRMNTYSIIFSPTGGTKKVADLFANAFADTYTEIDLTDADFTGSTFKSYVYFGQNSDSCIGNPGSKLVRALFNNSKFNL